MSPTEPIPLFINDQEIPWQLAGAGVRRKVIAWDKSLMLVKVEFEAGAVGPLHQHPHVQISQVESGIFEVELDGIKKRIAKGDGYFVPANVIHGCVCIEAGVLTDVFSPFREDFVE